MLQAVKLLWSSFRGSGQILQIVWKADDPVTFDRENQALNQAKKETEFPARITDYATNLREFYY